MPLFIPLVLKYKNTKFNAIIMMDGDLHMVNGSFAKAEVQF